MSFDPNDVAVAVEELAGALRADGGDLLLIEADPRTDRIRVAVSLDGVQCEECVLPPDMLHEMVMHTLTRRISGEFELLVDDPRREARPAP